MIKNKFINYLMMGPFIIFFIAIFLISINEIAVAMIIFFIIFLMFAKGLDSELERRENENR